MMMMGEEQIAELIAETLKWAARRASLPAITDIELEEGTKGVILFNDANGQPWALKVEAL